MREKTCMSKQKKITLGVIIVSLILWNGLSAIGAGAGDVLPTSIPIPVVGDVQGPVLDHFDALSPGNAPDSAIWTVPLATIDTYVQVTDGGFGGRNAVELYDSSTDDSAYMAVALDMAIEDGLVAFFAKPTSGDLTVILRNAEDVAVITVTFLSGTENSGLTLKSGVWSHVEIAQDVLGYTVHVESNVVEQQSLGGASIKTLSFSTATEGQAEFLLDNIVFGEKSPAIKIDATTSPESLGIAGDGSLTNPYVIENCIITDHVDSEFYYFGKDFWDPGYFNLIIKDRPLEYFEIRHCYLSLITISSTHIITGNLGGCNVGGIVVEDSFTYGAYMGCLFGNVSGAPGDGDITVRRSRIAGTKSSALFATVLESLLIEDCVISNNFDVNGAGVFASGFSSMTVTRCDFYLWGIGIQPDDTTRGSEINHLDLGDISLGTDNTIDGKPIFWRWKETGQTYTPSDTFMQIILLDCHQFILDSPIVTGKSSGLGIVSCTDGIVRGAQVSECRWDGLVLLYSDNIIVEQCLVHTIGRSGIAIESVLTVGNCSVRNNEVYDCGRPIRYYGAHGLDVIGNHIYSTDMIRQLYQELIKSDPNTIWPGIQNEIPMGMFEGAHDVLVEGNLVDGFSCGIDIHANLETGPYNLVIRNNVLISVEHYGYNLSYMSMEETKSGIMIDGIMYPTVIEGNTITDFYRGIYSATQGEFTITKNTIQATEIGIKCVYGATLITKNRISSNNFLISTATNYLGPQCQIRDNVFITSKSGDPVNEEGSGSNVLYEHNYWSTNQPFVTPYLVSTPKNVYDIDPAICPEDALGGEIFRTLEEISAVLGKINMLIEENLHGGRLIACRFLISAATRLFASIFDGYVTDNELSSKDLIKLGIKIAVVAIVARDDEISDKCCEVFVLLANVFDLT